MNQILINIVENGYVVTVIQNGTQKAFVTSDEDELIQLIEAVVADVISDDDEA